MTREQDEPGKVAQAHNVFVRLVLPPYTIHFKSPTYLHPTTLDFLDKKVCKETLKSSAQNASVRDAIGTDGKFWAELVALLQAAIPSLERRSFTVWDPSSVDYESTSGALIAGNCPGLWRDLERLNDLISISRNVLAVGEKVQDLAADHRIDSEIFRLINCCVRVTARGYDGDAGTGEEEKWQWVVNAYKKLLITSLQFLNNSVAQNETRKLTLWVSLFDNTTDSVIETGQPEKEGATAQPAETPAPAPPPARPTPPITAHDVLLAYGASGGNRISPLEMEGAVPLYASEGFVKPPARIERAKKQHNEQPNAFVYFTHFFKEAAMQDYKKHHKRNPSLAEIHLAIPRYWKEQEETEKDLWRVWEGRYEAALRKYRLEMEAWDASKNAQPTPKEIALPAQRLLPPTRQQNNDPKVVQEKIKAWEGQLMERYRDIGNNTSLLDVPARVDDRNASLVSPVDPNSAEKDDMRMLFTAEAGAKILESGKAELMKRLEGYGHANGVPPEADGLPVQRTRTRSKSPPSLRPEDPRRNLSDTAVKRRTEYDASVDDAFAEESLDEDEEDESDEEGEEDEEDYPGSTEDGRGLLTDVPLILGPSEIEVLPMLIMSGIVQPPGSMPPPTTNSHTLRTHLLLSQTSGRNLLRELLIFVAAWDLREEELYFKFMVKIMEAILRNGLMPYAYHAFRDRSRSKDIISPAQAVIMKLLTCIFRGPSGQSGKADGERQLAIASRSRNIACSPARELSPVDLHILNFIFTEFRQHIIPQTCALIFLQGQIHKGRASPEDFPLNLWDMERMYEGVYQYLEFFAVLTEEQQKGVDNGNKEGEEEGGSLSWKKILAEWEMASELVTLLRELEGGIPKMGSLPPLQQVPRRVPVQPSLPPPPQRSLSADAAVSIERPFDLENNSTSPNSTTNQIFEPETPLAYPPEDPAPHDQDEPSDFEWRNLKKLTVLVLSSLIWKNPRVQDQVRLCGGLEALVACCRPDEHNPYIREHAIMCLRFAIEGNEENAAVIRKMAADKTPSPSQHISLDVPKEVLDTNGYETFMDDKGQVGLRRKTSTANKSSSATASSIKLGKMTAERAAELMQNALRELPLGDNLLTVDKREWLQAEALAKLDRAFESTEKALGGPSSSSTTQARGKE